MVAQQNVVRIAIKKHLSIYLPNESCVKIGKIVLRSNRNKCMKRYPNLLSLKLIYVPNPAV